MTPDDVLSFLFANAKPVFGAAIVVALAVMVKIGKPRRWWAWLLDAGSVGAIAMSVLALYFFATVASAMDRRLDSLTITEVGSTQARKLADYRGKVVFLNYWATWCPPCRREIPAINKLVEAYRGKDVVFLAITEEDVATIEKFRAKVPMKATVARFTSDAPISPIEDMTFEGRPTTLVIDRDGRVRKRLIGAKSYEDFDAAINAASPAATSRAALR